MKSFLDDVVVSLLSRYQSLDKLILVFPNKRAGLYITQSFASALSKTVFAPRIVSIDGLMEEVSGLGYATKPQLLLELYRTYSTIPLSKKEDFHDFIKWGNTLLQDFNEIDRHLVESQSLFSYLESVKEIDHWYLKPERTKLITDYLQFWETLGDFYKAFRAGLANQGLGYQGMVYRKASTDSATYLENNEQHYIFIGFNALTASESQLIQNFLASGKAELFLDIDRYFLDDPVHDAGFFIRQYLRHWPFFQKARPLGISDNFLSEKTIELIGAPTNTAQAKHVGELLLRLAQENPSLSNTAVVLGDESLLNPLMNAIPEEVTEINITMGYPLSKTPAADLFRQLFSLYASTNKRGWYYKDVIDLLSHPYMQQLIEASGAKNHLRIIDEIVKRNATYVNPELLRGFKEGNDTFLHTLFPDGPMDSATFLRYCLKIISKLKELFQMVNNNMALEYLYGFFRLFNQLSELVKDNPFLTELLSLERLYDELLAQQTIDFKGEPIKGLQIMGMLESRNIDFETVIITSVNEGILPAGKTNNSFIPFDIKREFNLPSYKEKDAVYTYHFYRLLQRAKRVFLLYNTEPDVLEGGEKSRLIHQLITDPKTATYCNETLVVPNSKPNFPNLQTINKNNAILEALRARAERGFSPTSLSAYVKDPLDFYKTIVLGIEESEEIEEEVAARTFGIIVHNTLEELYTPVVGHVLTADHLKEMQKNLPGIVSREFYQQNPHADYLRGKNLIAKEVIQKYLETFLEMESSAIQEHRIEIMALEQKMQINLEIVGFDFPVVLKGTVDRIDRVDGALRVIDYKTGRVVSSEIEIYDWDLMKSESKYAKALQLMCYALLVAEHYPDNSLESGIITLKSLSEGFMKFSRKSGPGSRSKNSTIDREALDQFQEVLADLISEIFNPEVSIQEKEVL